MKEQNVKIYPDQITTQPATINQGRTPDMPEAAMGAYFEPYHPNNPNYGEHTFVMNENAFKREGILKVFDSVIQVTEETRTEPKHADLKADYLATLKNLREQAVNDENIGPVFRKVVDRHESTHRAQYIRFNAQDAIGTSHVIKDAPEFSWSLIPPETIASHGSEIAVLVETQALMEGYSSDTLEDQKALGEIATMTFYRLLNLLDKDTDSDQTRLEKLFNQIRSRTFTSRNNPQAIADLSHLIVATQNPYLLTEIAEEQFQLHDIEAMVVGQLQQMVDNPMHVLSLLQNTEMSKNLDLHLLHRLPELKGKIDAYTEKELFEWGN